MSSPVYFPPLFAADTLRSAWPHGRESHRERHSPATDLPGHDETLIPRRAPPLPHGEGKSSPFGFT